MSSMIFRIGDKHTGKLFVISGHKDGLEIYDKGSVRWRLFYETEQWEELLLDDNGETCGVEIVQDESLVSELNDVGTAYWMGLELARKPVYFRLNNKLCVMELYGFDAYAKNHMGQIIYRCRLSANPAIWEHIYDDYTPRTVSNRHIIRVLNDAVSESLNNDKQNP